MWKGVFMTDDLTIRDCALSAIGGVSLQELQDMSGFDRTEIIEEVRRIITDDSLDVDSLVDA